MQPLDRAIRICGTQSELARRVTGKPGTGHVYHWRNNGFSEDVALAIEQAQRDIVAEDPEAASRAVEVGGIATVEQLRPDWQWERGADGRVLRYVVDLAAVPASLARVG